MSDTPRTDAATHTEEGKEWLQEDAYRLHELSKQLERELYAAQKDAERYRIKREIDLRKMQSTPSYQGASKSDKAMMLKAGQMSYDAAIAASPPPPHASAPKD